MNFAFVLVSFGENEPAGMERAIASLCRGLHSNGHSAFVITAGRKRDNDSRRILRLSSLDVNFPCTDDDLKRAIESGGQWQNELEELVRAHRIDVVCWVDALWGLGAYAPRIGDLNQVLMVHVLGSGGLLEAALGKYPDLILAPSQFVINQAAQNGIDSSGWRVLPNSLLFDALPADAPRPQRIRETGPIGSIARLGKEKGIPGAIESYRLDRPYNVALGRAGFEPDQGGQCDLLTSCINAAGPSVEILPAISWDGVPTALWNTSVTCVPSTTETFGLVALESMSVGTPVVSFAVGNLSALIGCGGICVSVDKGFAGLWSAVAGLLEDPEAYEDCSRAGRLIASKYNCDLVASSLIELLS